MNHQYSIIAAQIGSNTTIPNWPTQDLEGVFQALDQWSLCPRLNMAGQDPNHPHVAYENPYRCLAWGYCKAEPIPEQNFRPRYVGTKPIYPDHPEAVSYCMNFLGYSFCINLTTDDPNLIAELDLRIAENMQRPEYIEAMKKIKRRSFA